MKNVSWYKLECSKQNKTCESINVGKTTNYKRQQMYNDPLPINAALNAVKTNQTVFLLHFNFKPPFSFVCLCKINNVDVF